MKKSRTKMPGGKHWKEGHCSVHLTLLTGRQINEEKISVEYAHQLIDNHASAIRGWIAGAREGHYALYKLRNSGGTDGIVGSLSESAAEASAAVSDAWSWTKQALHVGSGKKAPSKQGEVKLPEFEIWDAPSGTLAKAQQLIRAGELQRAIGVLNDAAAAYRDSYHRLLSYRERTEAGAETAIAALQIAKVAGAIAATIATGGLASGVVGTSLVAGSTAGVYAMALEASEQGSEKALDMRKEMDWKKVLEKGQDAAIQGLVGGFAAGALGPVFKAGLGKVLLKRIPPQFAQAVTTHLSEILAGIASGPITTAVTIAVHDAQGGRKDGETMGQFMERVGNHVWDEMFTDMSAENIARDILVQIGLGAMMRRRPHHETTIERAPAHVTHPPPMAPPAGHHGDFHVDGHHATIRNPRRAPGAPAASPHAPAGLQSGTHARPMAAVGEVAHGPLSGAHARPMAAVGEVAPVRRDHHSGAHSAVTEPVPHPAPTAHADPPAAKAHRSEPAHHEPVAPHESTPASRSQSHGEIMGDRLISARQRRAFHREELGRVKRAAQECRQEIRQIEGEMRGASKEARRALEGKLENVDAELKRFENAAHHHASEVGHLNGDVTHLEGMLGIST